ncbi:MAG: hypothetical protein HY853_01015 [Burkholderiales bacterium]|nr:hypothetical protein [Burkholderiales bacterium]
MRKLPAEEGRLLSTRIKERRIASEEAVRLKEKGVAMRLSPWAERAIEPLNH